MKLTDYSIERDGEKSKCPICDCWFSKHGLPSHFHRNHNPNSKYQGENNKHTAWNKGLNKSDLRVEKMSRKISTSLSGKKLPPLTEENRKKISASMKTAHAEGRAHNIGASRWNNEPSYPEKFFMRVIENEFEDKNYHREFSFGRFSLDFAWVEKKLCIEIDGEQHKRFKEYRERDERKDKALNDAGWKVLRIEWKNLFNDTKHWIEVAKAFINIPVEATWCQPLDC